jgi:excisionase family DNA binding protein
MASERRIDGARNGAQVLAITPPPRPVRLGRSPRTEQIWGVMLNLVNNVSISDLPNRESMTIGEAAAYTGYPRRAILQSELPTYMARGQWRIPTAAVRAYLEWQRDGLPVECLGAPSEWDGF